MAVTPNYYETLYVTRPDLQEEDLAKIQQKLQNSISANQGEVIRADKWAERELAYEIQDHKRAIYYILIFKALPSVSAEIEKHLRFYNTDILRFMTLKITQEAAEKNKASQQDKSQKADTVSETAEEVKVEAEPAPAPKVETEPAPAVSETAEEVKVEAEPAPAPKVETEPAPAVSEKAEEVKVETEPAPAPKVETEPAPTVSETTEEVKVEAEAKAEAEPTEETPNADKEEPAVEITEELEVTEEEGGTQ